jgi:beta-lactamase regulating signal transducer with metallopeptidase domain
MNSLIQLINVGAERLVEFAAAMLWQSSLLILVILVLDILLKRKLRASVRYALWLTVVVKLMLPPSLALPTSVAWWLRPSYTAEEPAATRVVVTYAASTPAATATLSSSPAPLGSTLRLNPVAWVSLSAGIVSMGLLAWLVLRWRQVAQMTRKATAAPDRLNELLNQLRRQLGIRRRLRIRVTRHFISPAICGLLRPCILLPASLSESFSEAQMRAVLVHELLHLKRGDLWVNWLQTVVQIVYWWNPLLWVANARLRLLREESVDEAVMVALRTDSGHYAPTLLEVARLALGSPSRTLGLLGILESRGGLQRRVERLVNFETRASGNLLITSIAVVLFAALVVPMGRATMLQSASVPVRQEVVSAPPPAQPQSAQPVQEPEPQNPSPVNDEPAPVLQGSANPLANIEAVAEENSIEPTPATVAAVAIAEPVVSAAVPDSSAPVEQTTRNPSDPYRSQAA